RPRGRLPKPSRPGRALRRSAPAAPSAARPARRPSLLAPPAGTLLPLALPRRGRRSLGGALLLRGRRARLRLGGSLGALAGLRCLGLLHRLREAAEQAAALTVVGRLRQRRLVAP